MSSAAALSHVTTLGRATGGVMAWRLRGQLHLSVVVKARFGFVQGAEMFLMDPDDLVTAEVHHDGAANKSVVTTTDFAPFLGRCDVTFVGRAHAPAGSTVARMKVRLAIDGAVRLLDKTLFVQGDLRGGEPKPFASMPLVYERAYGGPGWDANPLGQGFPARAGEAPAHNIRNARELLLTDGFGPISRAWPLRKRLLGGVARKTIEGPIAELPDEFDWSYFQAAPPDQRLPYLRGDEWIELEGLHPEVPIYRTRLPSPEASVRVYGLDSATDAGRRVELRADTLRIDGDAGTCSVTFRGIVPIRDPAILERVRLVGGVAMPNAPIVWPATAPEPSPRVAIADAETEVNELIQTLTHAGSLKSGVMAFGVTQPDPTPPPDFPPRSRDAVPIVTRAPVTAFSMPWQMRAGRDTRTIIVKATCDLVADAPARVRAEAEPPMGDVHLGDGISGSLLYPSDFALFKPRVDVTLRGSAYPAGGSGTAALAVFRFGRGARRFEKSVAAFGDRRWSTAVVRLSPTEPASFRAMPIVYERAYGGAGHAANPAGVGHGEQAALPNLEQPNELIASPSDSPEPAGFLPIAMVWPPRWSKLGTYDARWLASRYPYFPDDFDWAFFQAAPLGQQLDSVDGDEPFELLGLHKDHPRFSGKLPGKRARAFAQRTSTAGARFVEVELKLDTVTFEVDLGKLSIVWRGTVEVADEEASDIAEIFVMLEDLAQPKATLEAARAQHLAARTPAVELEASPEGRDRPANDGRLTSAQPPTRLGAVLAQAGIVDEGTSDISDADILEVVPDRPVADHDERARLRGEVEARLARGAALDGLELAGAELSDVDFRGRSLAGLNLLETKLARARLGGVDLSGAQLGGADLRDAVLEDATLHGADLTAADLEGAKLARASLDAADFGRARGARADFRGAKGARANFEGSAFPGANFEGAELPFLDLTRADVTRANFDKSKMRELRLYDARAERTSWKGADLTEARTDGAILRRAEFQNVVAPGSVWHRASLEEANFFEANLAGAIFTKAVCSGAVFSGAELAETRFGRANLRGAAMLKVNLFGASLEATDLEGADLRGSNLHGCETWKARLGGARLDLAILTQTKLKESR